MKRETKNRFLTSVLSLLLALSMVVTIPKFNVNEVKASTQTQSTDYQLVNNVQDGTILHAWNWSYNTIKSHLEDIAKAGFSTIQTSPVQQPKDYSNDSWTDVKGQWWKLYQPVSYSIASHSWLGTKSELTSLCQEADKYGIKIICDIVANHLGNKTRGVLSNEVAKYESTVASNSGRYVHPAENLSDEDAKHVTRGILNDCPDMNTGDSYIQGRVASLLKECIDCGVSGFRFDAAKHIETEDDGQYASQFWNNVLGQATSYAKSQKGKTLFYYGEILNSPGGGRSYNSYTKHMSITDNNTSNAIREDIKYGRADGAATSYYKTQQSPNKLVLWAESHDTFAGDDNGAYSQDNSKDETTQDINKTWAMVASRADAASLYFARPGSAKMGECGTLEFKSTLTSSVNHFHNYYVGAKEYTSSSGNIAMNERYFQDGRKNPGVVLVNVKGASTYVSNVKVNRLTNGTYRDQITGNSFVVSNGVISGNIGDTGVAVIYNAEAPKPENTISQPGGTFTTDTLTLTLGLRNAVSGTYKVGSNGKVTKYTKDTKVTIGSGMKVGDKVIVYTTATDSLGKIESYQFTFTKVVPSQDVTVYFTDNYNWGKVYAYYWGGKNPSAAWSGNVMQYAYTNEYGQKVYTYKIPTDVTGIIFNNGNGEQTVNISPVKVNNTGFYITGGPSNARTVGTFIKE